MKSIFLFLFAVLFSGLSYPYAQKTSVKPRLLKKTDVMVYEFWYNKKNIYVQNPVRAKGVGFCLTKIKVNGAEITVESSSAMEIALNEMNFAERQKIKIEIFHYKGCTPKILNPQK